MCILDELRGANWQRGARKGAPRPKPVSPLAKAKSTRYGGTTVPQDQVRAMLAKIGPQPHSNGNGEVSDG